MLHSGADDGFASGFDDARSDEETQGTEVGVSHALFVVSQVGDFPGRFFSDLLVIWNSGLGLSGNFLDVSLVEVGPPAQAIFQDSLVIEREENFAQVGDMFSSVIKVVD